MQNLSFSFSKYFSLKAKRLNPNSSYRVVVSQSSSSTSEMPTFIFAGMLFFAIIFVVCILVTTILKLLRDILTKLKLLTKIIMNVIINAVQLSALFVNARSVEKSSF